MGELILSCGHKASRGFFGHQISVKSYDRENNRVVDYLSVCDLCHESARLNGLILITSEQEKEWLDGEID